MAIASDSEIVPVRYGDAISLYCDDGPGFVYTQVTSSFHSCVAVSVQQERDLKNPGHVQEMDAGLRNVHVFTFQVLYPSKFRAQKHLLKVKEKENIGFSSSDQLTQDLAQAAKRYHAEQEENQQEQNRQRGRYLEYGQVVELLHLYTNQYLSASTATTSQLEPNNMQIKISSYGRKNSRFKVLPRYKVRFIGDKVMVGDQIQLESVKTEGHFLHCSLLSFGAEETPDRLTSTEEGSKELNLSANQSALTILRHYSPEKHCPFNAVRAGSIIRLFHQEVEGYLVAEGSFVEPELTENVHLRLRPVDQDRMKTLCPSTSAITYWQIELEKSPMTGEIIKWEQRCRFRHVCTSKYLCFTIADKSLLSVPSDPAVCPISDTCTSTRYTLDLTDKPGPSTVFRLFPVIQETDVVCFDSYCRIEHVLSRQWLHSLPDRYERQRHKTTVQYETGVQKLEWDGAKLKQVGSSDVMNYNDAFAIQGVKKEHVDILNFTAGMIPVIWQYIKDRKERRRLSRRAATRFYSALCQLGDFQIQEGEPVKDRQKLLRNFRIVDFMIEILKLPRMEEDHQNYVLVCRGAYYVLEKYIIGNSRKNELYVAKHIPFFQGQIGKGLDAETVVMELMRDNRKIVDRVSEPEIDHFVDFMTEKREHRFLLLLGLLCVCDGVAIPSNQIYVTKKLLQEDRAIMYLTKCGDDLNPPRDPQMVYVSEDGGATWISLADLAKAQDQNPSERYLFLERQLELFNQLCYGRNNYAIEVLTKKYLTWKEAFLCLRSKELPARLRAKFCNAIVGLFIDVGDNRSVLEKPSLSYVFKNVEERPYSLSSANPEQAITGARMEYFPQLRNWIRIFFNENKPRQAFHKGHNQLTTEVLRLLHYLVSYGYYSNMTDIKGLLRPMLTVMDGRDDFPFRNAQGEGLDDHVQKTRYMQCESNREVVNAKHMAMRVLDLLFNFRFNIRLERFLYEFRRVSSSDKNPVPLRGMSSSRSQTSRLSLFRLSTIFFHSFAGNEYLALMKPEKDCNVLANKHLATFARTQLEAILDDGFFSENEQSELIAILKDLSFYHYGKIVISSMHLMNQYFSATSTLFDQTIQAQIIVHPKSIEMFEYVEKTIGVLRRLAAAKMTPEQEIEMGEILDTYRRKCWIQDEHENEVEFCDAHRINQTILYNFGILGDIFDIIEDEIDVEREEYQGLQLIFRKSFRLLQALAHGNPVVQQRLYQRLDQLLTIRGAESEMANALIEVFGNEEMCMGIRSYQVQNIVQLLAVHKENASELLDLLKAVVKIRELDLPLKRNQGFVIKAINQRTVNVCGILDRVKAGSRMSLLERGDPFCPKLNYLLRLVDLLATCAEGENRFIESTCQNIFSISELFDVLLNPNIIVACKRPYIRFLVWVYLNTGSSKVESGAADLDHDEKIWTFLEQVGNSLSEINADLLSISENKSKVQALRSSLRFMGSVRTYPAGRQRTYIQHRPMMKRQASSAARLLDEGFLLYFFDGVLPLLQVFYTSYFEPEKLEPRRQRDFEPGRQRVFQPGRQREIDISHFLADTLINISLKITGFLAHEAQYRLLRRTTTVILTQLNVDTSQRVTLADKISEFKMSVCEGEAVDLKSSALKKYEREHYTEEMLNFELNNFATNFKRAYQKRNTTEDQIGVAMSKPYCESEDKDEPLPLGKEFQDHVAVFFANGKIDPVCGRLVESLCFYYSSVDLGEMSEAERICLEQLCIRTLQVLRAIIHNQIVRIPELKEGVEVPRAHKLAMKAVEDVQTALNVHGVALKIIPLLSHSNDNIVRETLALLSALVYSGNRSVQESFEKHFFSMRKDRFVIDVLGRLQRSAVVIRERRTLLSQQKAKLKNLIKMARIFYERTSLISTSLMTKDEEMGLATAEDASNDVEMQQMNKKVETALDETAIDEAASVNQLRFRDDSYIEIVLRILGYMCDGQNVTLQDYLREQPDNIKSLNLVSEVCSYLHLFYNAVDKDSIPLLIQLFNTLIEFASGNPTNQATLFDHQIIYMINDVMRLDEASFTDVVQVYKLKRAAINLLATMVEKNNDETKELARGILDTIHIGTLYENIVSLQDQGKSDKRHEEEEKKEEAVRLAFAIEHVLMRFRELGSFLCGKKWKLHYPSKAEEEIEEELAESTMSVEIVEGDELQKVFFHVKDQKALREEVKERLKWKVSRESPTSKLRDFLEWSNDIQRDIHHQKRIQNNVLLSLLVQGSSVWFWMVLLLTVVLNIFVVVAWKAPPNLFEINPIVEPYFHPVLYVVGLLHLIFSVCLVVTFYVANAHNFVLPSFFYPILRSNPRTRSHSSINNHSSINVLGVQSLFYVVFVLTSALSLRFHGAFYCFHLFIVFVNNDILTRVLQSVTRNGVSLLWVGAMMVIIIYIYSVVAFTFLRQSFDPSTGLYCENLAQCFVTSIKVGLLTGGGLGEALPAKAYSFYEPAIRTIFDVSFFIIITIISLNIVFGIIVDSFSELRDDKWKAQNDMNSVCFICGNPSFEFEKKGKGFEYHVKKEHNMWAYFFFFIHLSEKLPNDYTSIERYVAQKLEKNEIDFFPLSKAMSLNDEEDTTVIDELEELKKMNQNILTRNAREDAKLRRRMEKQEHALWERRQALSGKVTYISVDEESDVGSYM
ncbi:inositol 1,4,5-trisphosphate-gated calcium channel ITPR1-like isoform X3 [Oscarella lobularis]|uniref:inositol 1,4,5-trisphosphate-gated calcium channel ITPR1-like isoform X3 n=1 Tax=Oscarella lobularis TaxID=121494 RepID=UPI0033132D7F